MSRHRTAIRDLEVQIREFVSHPPRQDRLLSDKPLWNILCSALDVLGDTQLAVESYLALPETDDTGTRYLLTYGILQVLFVQQDAVRHLLDVFELKYDTDPVLEAIREVRNKTTGHPASRPPRKSKHAEPSSHFLVRNSLRKGGYRLMTSYPERKPDFEDVDILELIVKQRAEVRTALEQIWAALNADDECSAASGTIPEIES
jgi:hypothetical protein